MASPLNGTELVSVIPLQANGQPGATFQQTTTAAIGDSRTVGNALTAVGTNRTTALVLANIVNVIATAAASTGVVLPAAIKIGQIWYIYNNGASPIQVYANGSDQIDTVAGATGVVLTNAKRAIYTVVAAGTWISAQLGVVSA